MVLFSHWPWCKEQKQQPGKWSILAAPTAGFSELLCLLPNEPQENHNFKTYFIWESQNYFGSSLEGEKKRELIPFQLPPPDKKKSYNIRHIGASYRNTFEDLQYCTMSIFGKAILRLSKCLETLFKCPFVFAWPKCHFRIIEKAFVSSMKLGNFGCKKESSGNLRLAEKLSLFGAWGCMSAPCRVRATLSSLL